MSFNLSSDNVRVFPFGSERIKYKDDRVLNEQNLSMLIRSMSDNTDYVCNYAFDDNNVLQYIEFLLYGYRFQIELPVNLFELESFKSTSGNSKAITAVISIDTTNTYTYLSGTDTTEGKFAGLSLYNCTSEDLPEQFKTGTYHYLQLTDSNGNIINTSATKFNRIYCGNASYLVD